MGYSQKYCIVLLRDRLPAATESSMAEWPVHITLADVFAIELIPKVIKEMEALARSQSRIEVVARNEMFLGETKVVLLERDSALQELHDSLIDLLHKYGAWFNTPEYNYGGFLPHSTIQKNGRLELQEKFILSSLTLIDMFPDSNWKTRKVIKTFDLKQS